MSSESLGFARRNDGKTAWNKKKMTVFYGQWHNRVLRKPLKQYNVRPNWETGALAWHRGGIGNMTLAGKVWEEGEWEVQSA